MASGFVFPSWRLYWTLAFAYASFAALLLQKAVLPLLPEMHAGHGLLVNDAIAFHNMAVEIAQRIHTGGWSEWHLYPPGASGNVGLLAVLYVLLGPDPAWFIPFNAAAHATGSVLIYRIGVRLADGDVGRIGGLVAAICFLVFPSALQWYGQNHKDAFAIVGLLLALNAWLALHDDRLRFKFQNLSRILLSALSGIMLLGLVRPYFIVVVTVGFSVSFLLASIWRSEAATIAVRLMFVAIWAIVAAAVVRQGTSVTVFVGNPDELNVGAFTSASERTLWKESEYLPAMVDKYLRRASELRAHFLHFGRSVKAGSEVDGDRLPDSASAALEYFPRALVVGLLAPFPNTWSERTTLPRLIGAMETAAWYLAGLGGLIAIVRYRSRKLIAGVVFCAFLIAVLAYIHPNVGTLYRQRYGPWHFFMLIGCIGWVSLLSARRPRCSPANQAILNVPSVPEQKHPSSTATERLVGSGAVVLLITLACYLGFFARDLLLTGQLGLGEELDAFFSAAMIPMFFVTCFAMPLGDAMVLPFLSAGAGVTDERARLLRGTLGLALLLLGFVVCFVVATAPLLVMLIVGGATEDGQAMAVAMLRLFSPIIALSALTVIGNAALNSIGKPSTSALAQLTVPAMTLAALVLAPSEDIVAAAIGGMLLGTLVNAVVLYCCLRYEGLVLLPGDRPLATTVEVRSLYWPLVAAAILPAALVPMNYAFAASVSAGKVAAWAFSSKIVILFNGLAGVGATAVVLPQIAQALTLRDGRVRQYANILIGGGIWLGGVLMLGGFLFAEPVVAGLLGKQLSPLELSEMAAIVRIGLLQVPIVIIGALVSKLAIAAGRTSRVMFSALIAFCGNVALNVVLVPMIGVMGVAIGALVAGFLSVAVTLSGVYRQIGLTPRELITVLACWLAWVAVCVGLQSNSVAAIASALIALGAMAIMQWMVLQSEANEPVKQN